jgi:hypothetical protein
MKSIVLLVVLLSFKGAYADNPSRPCADISPSVGQTWQWMDRDCRIRTRGDLDGILASHKQWLIKYAAYLDSDQALTAHGAFRDSLRANLSQSQLKGLTLIGDKSTHLDLRYAELTNSDFTNAVLDYADFSNASLDFTDFSNASLDGATFTNTHLRSTHFWKAHLGEATLTGADLGISAQCTDLSEADLHQAHLNHAILTGAFLQGTDLTNADVTAAVLNYVFYEPSQPPTTSTLARAVGLWTLRWEQTDFDELAKAGNPTFPERWLMFLAARHQEPGTDRRLWGDIGLFLSEMFGNFEHLPKDAVASPSLMGNLTPSQQDLYPLLDLRRSLSKAGYQDTELEVNLAYHRHIQSTLGMIVFDWTCEYGAAPFRPLYIALALAFLAIPLYWIGFRYRLGTLLIRTEIHGNGEIETPITVRPSTAPAASLHKGWRAVVLISHNLREELCLLKSATFFSLISVVDLGFDGLDFGRWVRMLFWRDYDLKAQGWLRTVSGVQSLIGLGLLALSLLSFFGHPFN